MAHSINVLFLVLLSTFLRSMVLFGEGYQTSQAYLTIVAQLKPSNDNILVSHVHQGPLLLTWISFNSSMDEYLHPL